MKKKGILLLGGDGFLGGALARQLVDNNKRVHIMTPNKHPGIASNAIIHQASLDDERILKSILPECGTIIHLASSTNPGNSARHPALEAKLNITPTLNFLEILQGHEPIHLIYISSGGTIYGNPETIPVNEKHQLTPLSYYGAGKVAIETFLRVSATPLEQNVTIIRPPNFYGPGQSYHQGFGVIRTMLEHIHRGTTMEIWGNGEVVRDFLYVDDMVSAVKLLIDLPTDNNTYNIATGTGLSLNQAKDIIETVINKKLNVKYRMKRKSDVNSIALDSTRFIKKTGWQPKITFEKGILLTWQWVQRQ